MRRRQGSEAGEQYVRWWERDPQGSMHGQACSQVKGRTERERLGLGSLEARVAETEEGGQSESSLCTVTAGLAEQLDAWGSGGKGECCGHPLSAGIMGTDGHSPRGTMREADLDYRPRELRNRHVAIKLN